MKETLHFQRASLPTPIGSVWIVTDSEERVRALDWEGYESRMTRLLDRHYASPGYTLATGKAPATVRDAIRAYFAGELGALDALPVATGGSEFQRQVWAGLRRIAVGTTISYGELARRIGRPSAIRAVGLANGSNPIGVIVPCHRVIGADGSLTGYAHGIERKRWLLRHEGWRLAAAGGEQLRLDAASQTSASGV